MSAREKESERNKVDKKYRKHNTTTRDDENVCFGERYLYKYISMAIILYTYTLCRDKKNVQQIFTSVNDSSFFVF